MGWEDREYYREGGGYNDYLGNPASILGLSLPIGTWFGVPVRLHFWMLLSLVFILFDLLNGLPLWAFPVVMITLVGSVLLHEFGHRFFAHAAGGRHEQFTLWPAGGMTFPQMPPGPGALFVGNIGGIVANLLLIAIAWGITFAKYHAMLAPLSYNPLLALSMQSPVVLRGPILLSCLGIIFFANVALVLINLLPYYWFDGGNLLQSILTPFVGTAQGTNVTCIFAMILAVPMILLSLKAGAILSLFVWVLLFASSYSHRKAARHIDPEQDAIALSAQGTFREDRPKRRWMGPTAKSLAAQAARAKSDQAKIDKILEKVSAQGMISLTWLEKRTLRKATERQQKTDARRGFRSGQR